MANLGYTVNLLVFFFPNPLYKHKILNCKFKYAKLFNFKEHINLLSSFFQQHFIKCFTVKFQQTKHTLQKWHTLVSSKNITKFKNVCMCQYRTLCPRAALLVGIPWFCAKVHWKWQEQTPKKPSLHCLWMVWAYICIDILTTSPWNDLDTMDE